MRKPPLRQLATGFVLSGAGLLSTLLVLEVAVRLLMPQDLNFYNWETIARSSRQPGQQVELIPNAATDSFSGQRIRINSLGLRDREITVPKPISTFRILAVGDSVIFGTGVNLEQTFVKQLETHVDTHLSELRLTGEVINAGVEGNGLTYYRNFLRTTARRLAPDLILVGIALNDIMDYERRYGLKGHPRQLSESRISKVVRAANRVLLLNSHLYLAVYSSLKSVFYRVGILDLNKTHDYDYLTFQPPSEQQAAAWRSSYALLDEIIGLSRNLNTPLVFVIFPMEFQRDAEHLEIYRRTFRLRVDDEAVAGLPQRRLAEFARSRRVPAIDLLPSFQKSTHLTLYLRNHMISHDPTHFSAEGHAVVAQQLFPALRDLGLLPTPPRRGSS